MDLDGARGDVKHFVDLAPCRAEQAEHGDRASLVARLRCLRAIDTLTAIGLVAEIGDFAAFDRPTRRDEQPVLR